MDTSARTRSGRVAVTRGGRLTRLAATGLGGGALAAVLLALTSPPAGQNGDDWVVPRTGDGHPDLQGNWSNGTMTPIERPPGVGAVLTPEQVAALVARHEEVSRARVIASREGERDVMTVQIEADGGAADSYAASVTDVLKLKGRIEIVARGSLPNDGKVIEDQRSYD